jgi:hypothetical protein
MPATTEVTLPATSANARRSTASNRTAAPSPSRATGTPPRATDDEILGIVSPRTNAPRDAEQLAIDFDADTPIREPGSSTAANSQNASDALNASEPENLRAAFDANPELREAWHDAAAFREAFPSPEAAREATVLLEDLNRMDALFFSRRPEDHAALARAIADLDPAAFASLARAITEFTRNGSPSSSRALGSEVRSSEPNSVAATSSAANPADQFSVGARHAVPDAATPSDSENLADAPAVHESQITSHESRLMPTPSDAQTEFFHATNASAVEGVISAIESQVERLLPEGITKSARARVVGEIYRELDANLRSNRQLASQMRDAFRSGSLDADHQRAIVSLITSRARQALPGVAKRVLNEWTSTLVTANQERRTRQRTAEKRVDIAGSSGAGNDGRRSMSPRDLDYSRLSDADILNL